MKIEDRRPFVLFGDAAQGPAGDAIRQQAEVSPTAARQVAIEQVYRGDRALDDRMPGRGAEGKARSLGHAVVVVLDRIEAGAVVVAFLRQDIETRSEERRVGKECGSQGR